ncbi:RNA-directed DNA polymerase [Sphingomonas sp. BE270]|jgi:RNA-directed DNA polymerase|uniref:reverse transcriptase family protein n=1 Tax=unclassified Sphingomonas TaxID=196159 RepID=UPI00053EA555
MWSPQRYIEHGLTEGYDAELVRSAAGQIDDFLEKHPDLPPILTLGHLGKRTSLPYARLRKLVSGLRSNDYSYFRIRKRSGGHRQISVPEADLMWLQRWVSAHILSKLKPHRASYAFAPKASIVSCAKAHCEARWLIKLDISGFFGSVSEIQVYRVFLAAGYAPMVAFQLARLTTHAPYFSMRYKRPEWRAVPDRARLPYLFRTRLLGFLPQGAPSSPMLSNLVMRQIDAKLHAIALSAGLTYTRYSDDITFSTRGGFDRERARAVVSKTRRILAKEGFTLNSKKTRIVPPGGRKLVLGLLVDGSEPNLTRAFKDSLRQHLHYVCTFGPDAHAKRRGFDTVSSLYRHLLGLINYAKSVDEDYALRARTKLNSVQWSL